MTKISDLTIKRIGMFTTPPAQPADCTICGDAEWGDVLINGVCGKCLRAENEKLKAEVAKLLDWQIRVLQTMDNCRTGDCSCGTDEDCQSLFREATEKGGE